MKEQQNSEAIKILLLGSF